MTADYTNQVTVGLLMLSLISVLAIGILAAFLALLYHRRKEGFASGLEVKNEPVARPPRRFHPSIFENDCRWLVVRGHHLAAVQAALDLHNPTFCSWGEGLASMSGHKLFIAPPVRGWILVIGPGLPDANDDVDQLYHFVCKLSRSLGHLQFFSVNRALDHHTWVRAEGGKIRRAYAWAGETLWNEGPLTPEEMALNLKCHAYGEKPDSPPAGLGERTNSDKLVELASRWSIDPAWADDGAPRSGLGVTGDLVDYRLP